MFNIFMHDLGLKIQGKTDLMKLFALRLLASVNLAFLQIDMIQVDVRSDSLNCNSLTILTTAASLTALRFAILLVNQATFYNVSITSVVNFGILLTSASIWHV